MYQYNLSIGQFLRCKILETIAFQGGIRGAGEGEMSKSDVVIIGAGMAGLAAAIELSAAGLEVLVLEKENAPGGKMRQIMVDGAAVDAGPTVFTMRWVFDALLDKANTTLDAELNLKQASILARHVWDGDPDTVFDLYADINQSADAIGQFSNAQEAAGYRAFCAQAKDIFNTLKTPYITSQRPGLLDLPRRVGLTNLARLNRTKPFTTMWSALGKHFKDPRLQQLFGRYATYCGSSPFQAAATLMLVAHVEQDGVWLVDGGMHHLARTLKKVAERKGCVFSFNQGVSEIETTNGSVSAVITDTGERHETNHVICNADVAAVSTGLFGKTVQPAVKKMQTGKRSLSAMIWTMNTKTSGFGLSHHTVFFSKNYKQEFDALYKNQQIPAQPTTYICAQDRDDFGHLKTTNQERLLVLINAPATGDAQTFSSNDIEHHQENTFDLLERCGLEVSLSQQSMEVTTPTDFNKLFPATGGALYGRASHGWHASFERPEALTKIPGLYLASGSAHPGPGVPMAALSGILAAERVVEALPRSMRIPQNTIVLEAAQ